MLKVENLQKSYDSTRSIPFAKRANAARQFAVDGVDFDVAEGELVTLLGPSGCGKTTTLRSIAGLETPDGGAIRLAGDAMFSAPEGVNVPPNQRGLGMVFQSYAIWPHMDVYHNVAFPLDSTRRQRGMSGAEVRKKVLRILEVVELASFADRPATNLSGGQQQRLALARALVTEPQLVLLDEPLSNLDAKLRESMRLELKAMQARLGLTMLYVTHDQQEALALSSKVIVMNKGKIVQSGRPREIYTEPKSRFVAEFIGTSNFLEGVVTAADGAKVKVKTSEGELWSSNADVVVGDSVAVSIRHEDIGLAPLGSESTGANEWTGTVVTRAFLGDVVEHLVRVGDTDLTCRVNPSISIPTGDSVRLTIDPSRVRLLRADS